MLRSLLEALGLCPAGALPPPAAAPLAPETPTLDAVQALRAQHQPIPAVRLLASSMPPDQGTLWACKSTDTVAGQLTPEGANALGAAKAWGGNPTEAARQQALAAGAQAPSNSPGKWAALAAGWSEGSIVPPGPPPPALPELPELALPAAPKLAAPVPPEAPPMLATPNLTPQAVSGAVLLSAVMAKGQVPAIEPPPPPPPPGLPVPEIPEFAVPAVPELAPPTLPRPELPQLNIPNFQPPRLKPPLLPGPPVAPEQLTPAQVAELDKTYDPYLDLGVKIAKGEITW